MLFVGAGGMLYISFHFKKKNCIKTQLYKTHQINKSVTRNPNNLNVMPTFEYFSRFLTTSKLHSDLLVSYFLRDPSEIKFAE